MNIDAVLKRLDALEGKITGTMHIESIIVGIPGCLGVPVPCPDANTYKGQFLVLENTFLRKEKHVWEYKPRMFLISDYRNYKPPASFKNGVIFLIRRGAYVIGKAAQDTIDEAMKAVEAANNVIEMAQTN